MGKKLHQLFLDQLQEAGEPGKEQHHFLGFLGGLHQVKDGGHLHPGIAVAGASGHHSTPEGRPGGFPLRCIGFALPVNLALGIPLFCGFHQVL